MNILEQHNVRFVGYHDLESKPGFKMGIQRCGERWYLYVAHLWHRGWSVLDVTNPAEPQYLSFTPGPRDTWTIQVQVADGKMITALEKPVEGWGIESGAQYDEGALIWDVESNPAQPRLLGKYETGGTGTHRNFYAGGRYVYMTANPAGFEGNILTIVDIDNPAQPVEVSRWWWPGQNVGAGESPEFCAYFHGPAYVVGERAYLSYGQVGLVILDVSDVWNPKFVSRVSFGNLGSSLGCHSAVPIPDRKIVIVNSEAILEGSGDGLNYVFVVDVADELHPKVLSSFPVPTPEPGLPYQTYYEKGGRFGPHNQHHHQGHPDLMPPSDIVYLTYFNAGLRVFSIADPLVPREVGHFVPADPTERLGVLPSVLVTQFEDVLVDSRGYVYCTDKNFGLFVLQYTGTD
ncbi:LVIVD repeat-containing protein [Alicyclobacillus macrosporangiidus]|uniref:LVIVD repeat-containing protein n=1 Tax=Alicyclobacillus macrosporangiidus TaxID=392015 RepID=UPI00068D844D|nr:hypothetical protein [Alicyclobacillus macrosporangiidus]